MYYLASFIFKKKRKRKKNICTKTYLKPTKKQQQNLGKKKQVISTGVLTSHQSCSQSSFVSWAELPQVSFLSQQKFCCNKHVFVATKQVCCCDQSRHMFVVTKIFLSRQARFCSDKRCVLSRQTFICGDKHSFVVTNTFVVTKLLLWQIFYLWQLWPMIDSGSTEHIQLHSSTAKTFHVFICTHSEFQGKAGAERWQHVCKQGKASSLLSVSPGEGTFTSVSPSEWTFTYIRLTRWMDVVKGHLFLSLSLGE